MKCQGVWNWVIVAMVIALLGAVAGAAEELLKPVPAGGTTAPAPARASPPVVKDPHHRMNLFGKPEKPRFELKDRDWPDNVGEASVCLWKDDAIAALSMGVDDNWAPNLPWWMEMCKKYDLRPTWWVISGNVVPGNVTGGTWETWRKVLAAGFDVQSHTVNHLNTKSATWTGKMEDEYGNSQKVIAKNVPGARCVTLAYPGGEGQEVNDPAVAARYYIAARTTYPLINEANNIDYLQINGDSQFLVDDGKWPSVNLVTVFDNSPKNKYWRGWWVGFFHGVATDKPEVVAGLEKKFAYIQGKVKSGELWGGLFREVAEYGQERDTAKLAAKVSGDKIVITLSDDMDDALFDFPLTVKVRVDAGWKGAKAVQGGKPVGCVVVEHAGGRFALVQVVPDRGDVEVRGDARGGK